MKGTSRAAIALAFIAAVATIAAVVATRDGGGASVESTPPAAYDELGPVLTTFAMDLDLRGWKVKTVTQAREFAGGFGDVAGADGISYRVTVERSTERDGKRTTVLNVELHRETGSDIVLLPWQITKVIADDEFVLAADLTRATLSTNVCDERTGETKRLSVRWRAKGLMIDSGEGVIVDGRTSDASIVGRFGPERFNGSVGGVGRQLVSREVIVPDPHVRLDGRRLKPVKCPRQ